MSSIDPNAHTPVARAIEAMQRKWIAAVENQPNYTLARWLIAEEEAVLLTGFCKLESSAYGQLPEIFSTLFTPFENSFTYSQQLILDWLELWDKNEKYTASLSKDWGYDDFKQKAAIQQDSNTYDYILIALLQSIHKTFADADVERPFVLSLLPQRLNNIADYNQWLQNITPKLPAEIKLMIVDYIGKDYFQKTCHKLNEKAITIACGNLNVQKIIKDIATVGNPNAPEVQFKKCLFAMGEAVVAHNRTDLDHWGQKALSISQRSGVKSFYATAHIVYAGFIMQLKPKDAKIKALLDNGIRIAQTAPKEDTNAIHLIGQFYAYLTAWHSIQGENGQAAAYLLKQANIAIQQKHEPQAIVSLHRAAELYKKNHNSKEFQETVTLGFKTGENISDELLMISADYMLLGRAYYNFQLQQKQLEEAQAINDKMIKLYGEDWLDNIITQENKNKGVVTLDPTTIINTIKA